MSIYVLRNNVTNSCVLVIEFEMETNKAWCGLCKQSFTTLFVSADPICNSNNKSSGLSSISIKFGQSRSAV